MKRGSRLYQAADTPDYYTLIYRGTPVLYWDKARKTITIDTAGYITRSTTDCINIALEDIGHIHVKAKHKPSLNQIILEKEGVERPFTYFNGEYQEVTLPEVLLTKKD